MAKCVNNNLKAQYLKKDYLNHIVNIQRVQFK